MVICDRCGETGTTRISKIELNTGGEVSRIWEATVSSGDLCVGCLRDLEEMIDAYMTGQKSGVVKR